MFSLYSPLDNLVFWFQSTRPSIIPSLITGMYTWYQGMFGWDRNFVLPNPMQPAYILRLAPDVTLTANLPSVRNRCEHSSYSLCTCNHCVTVTLSIITWVKYVSIADMNSFSGERPLVAGCVHGRTLHGHCQCVVRGQLLKGFYRGAKTQRLLNAGQTVSLWVCHPVIKGCGAAWQFTNEGR